MAKVITKRPLVTSTDLDSRREFDNSNMAVKLCIVPSVGVE